MRLATPLIFLLIALAIVCAVDRDAGGLVSVLPAGKASDISGPFTNRSAPQRFMRTAKIAEFEYEVPSGRVADAYRQFGP